MESSFSTYFLNNPQIWFSKNYYDSDISSKFNNFIFTKNIFENVTLQTDNKELLDFIITFDLLYNLMIFVRRLSLTYTSTDKEGTKRTRPGSHVHAKSPQSEKRLAKRTITHKAWAW